MRGGIITTAVIAGIGVLAGIFVAAGQSHSEYKFVFTGTAYQTNASEDIVGTPISDQTLLRSRGVPGDITNLSTVAIVYSNSSNVVAADSPFRVARPSRSHSSASRRRVFSAATVFSEMLYRINGASLGDMVEIISTNGTVVCVGNFALGQPMF